METPPAIEPTPTSIVPRCFGSLVVAAQTSLFMHGARGSQFAELRPTAVRGAMRYWFRALAMARSSRSDALQVEKLVFGGREQRSRVLLQMRKLTASPTQGYQLPHKDDLKQRQKAGCFAAGGQFELALLHDYFSKSTPQIEAAALGALWVTTVLGGLGARCRRGAGSVQILNVTPSWEYPSLSDCGDAATMAARIAEGLQCASRHVEQLFAGARNPVDHQLPCLSSDPARTRIVVAPFGEGEEEAQRAKLMLLLREFKNPAFGLPLQLEGKWVQAVDKRVQHFASPLWARLHRGSTQWFLILTVMAPVPDAPGSDIERIYSLMHSIEGGVPVSCEGLGDRASVTVHQASEAQ